MPELPFSLQSTYFRFGSGCRPRRQVSQGPDSGIPISCRAFVVCGKLPWSGSQERTPGTKATIQTTPKMGRLLPHPYILSFAPFWPWSSFLLLVSVDLATSAAADPAGSSCCPGGSYIGQPAASSQAKSSQTLWGVACLRPQRTRPQLTVWGLPRRLSGVCCGTTFLRSGRPLCQRRHWLTARPGWEFAQCSPQCAWSCQTSRGPGITTAGHDSQSASLAARVIPCPSFWWPYNTSEALLTRARDGLYRRRWSDPCWCKGSHFPCSRGPS